MLNSTGLLLRKTAIALFGFALVFTSFTNAKMVSAAPALGNPNIPQATIGQPYTYQFQATGGIAPYVFEKWYFNYPSSEMALSSSGLFSGTPRQTGSWMLGVRTSDATGLGTYSMLTFQVNAAHGNGGDTTSPTLSVSLNSASPSGTVLAGLPNFPFASFKLQNTGSSSVSINSLQVVSNSVNVVNNLFNIQAYKDNSLWLGNIPSLNVTEGNLHYAVLDFPDPLSVLSNSTLTLDLSASLSNSASGSARLGIRSLQFGSSGVTVSGSLPVFGNTLTIVGNNQAASGVTVMRDGGVADNITVNPGQADVALLAARFSATGSDAYIHGLTLSAVYPPDISAKLSNLRAQYGSTVVWYANSNATDFNFVFSPPILVARDSSQVVKILANIMSNASGSLQPKLTAYNIKNASGTNITPVTSDVSTLVSISQINPQRSGYMKVQEDPTVYWVSSWGGKMPMISERVFLSYGAKWSDVRIIYQEELDEYEEIFYIKLAGNARVYRLENSVKRYLYPAAATRLNVDPTRVITVNATEFYAYYTGSSIK